MADLPAILAEGLGKRFGPVQALDGVDLRVPAGQLLGLLGPNGAGKTTAVRILTTLVVPDAGSARVAGFDVRTQAAAVRRMIGLSGQNAAVDPYLSGRENLRMIGRLGRLDRAAAHRRAEELLEVFELTGSADRQARTWSGGMRRRLDVAASLVAQPAVLFLDEPTTGLDPRSRAGVWQLLTDLVADGTTVLLTTQYLEEADRLADQIVVIDAGRVIAQGSPDDLKARLGGDRLELRPVPGLDVDRLAAALAGLGSGPAVRDADRLLVPVANGAAVLPELARRLDRAEVAVAGLALRRPTLDDVFLTVTGRTSDPPADCSEPARPAAPVGKDRRRTATPTGSTGAETASLPGRSMRRAVAHVGGAVTDVIVVSGRNLRRLVRVPTLALLATVQPVLLVLLFTYAFGGAVHTPGVRHYIDYLLPGLFLLAIGFGAAQTGVAIAEDLGSGMLDRYRSLPIAASAVLVGRACADAVRNLFVVGLMIAVGALLGFRFHAGAGAALAAMGLAVTVGLAFSWLNLLLGLLVRDSESAGLAGLFPVIILVFTSSTLVPVATMPGWLQPFAAHQPITVTVDALRALSLGGPTTTPVLQALTWSAGLLAAAGTLTVAAYRRAASA